MDVNTSGYYYEHNLYAEEMGNPLLKKEGLILFDQIQPHHFMPAFEAVIQDVESKLDEIENTPTLTWETIIDPLEQIEEKLFRVVGPMVHLLLVNDSDEIREAWNSVEPLAIQFQLRLMQSQSLYDAFEILKEGDNWENFSDAQKRLLEQRLLEARLNGIELEGNALEKFNELICTLNELQTEFVANMRDATKNFSLIVDDYQMVDGIPYSILKLTSESFNLTRDDNDPESSPKEGPWKLSLARPVYSAVIHHCHNRELREILYRAQVQKASVGEVNNTENIQKQLLVRKEIAELLGFETYADLSLATKMARDVRAVKDFLNELRDASWITGREDLLEVQLFAARMGFRELFMPWDFPYWSERLKEERFHLSEKELKPYFQLPIVLNGLFDLCQKLFGIEIIAADFNAPVWHLDVNYYIIKDEDGTQLGSFYLDPYSRDSKRSGAWTETCQNRVWIDGKLQLPIAYIVCNASPPTQNAPALLAFQEVVTLFHEFGHGLQHVLTNIDYASISGTNGMEWDAVELASKFMENWCYHKPTLRKITEHYKTGESLPEVLLDKIIASRTFHAGSNMLAQIKYSLCDIALHHDFDPSGTLSPFDIWYEISLSTSHLPCLQEDRFLCSFHHVFGGDAYAAAYYSYRWAEVLSADIFQVFKEAGAENWPLLRELGEKFKHTFLELGGSMHPMQVFELFRGRPPSINALLEQNGFSTK